MNIIDELKNETIFRNKYKTHNEAVIISCFFNPTKSKYRTKAFKIFYDKIKHLNHRIIECVIGDSSPELEENKNIKRIYTKNLLWHKESLLNNIIKELPEKYKYIFWIDADVIFENDNWMVDGVKQLQYYNLIQPFEYCFHLEKDELFPLYPINLLTKSYYPNRENKSVWRSFCSNVNQTRLLFSNDYNEHGHVGFAWGAKREVLDKVPLYDKALIGGADHIMAHASVGQINHNCITKSFKDNIDEVNDYSKRFLQVVQGRVGYVNGNLFHIWHGDIEKRQYLKRIIDFTPRTKEITSRDENGLFLTNKPDEKYIVNYFNEREVTGIGFNIETNQSDNNFDGFGGGTFDGGGAGGSYEINNDNFS
jgi:hypothetical protein